MVARLQEQYRNEVAPALAKEFGFDNPHSIPRLEKIVISMGMGDAREDASMLEAAQKQLAQIAGQWPVVTRARRAISNFKLRRGDRVGLKVTLRGQRMYEFFDRLVSMAIPRVKDFRGLNPSGFDGRGNYNMGLAEQTVFPEIDPSDVSFTQGMNIVMQTSADSDEHARQLLKLMGMPFRES